MRYFVDYDTNRYRLDVPPNKEVRWIKQILRDKTGCNTGEKFVLCHGTTELQDDWVLSKLASSIPAGSVIHCSVCKNRLDIEVELNYSGKRHSIMEEFSRADTVHDLKCEIQFRLGLPVSSFTLYCGNRKMYDSQKLDEFNIYAPATITLLSWKGWNKFLWCATEGRTKQLAGSMKSDQFVYKYQQRVALFIAAHYNHVDMASQLLQLGVSCSKPVGVHPGKLWCDPLQKSPPELTTPIFHAAAKGNLDVLRLFLEAKPDLLMNLNSQGNTLIDVALKHRHIKCVEYMKTVKLRSRSAAFTKYSYTFKLVVRLVRWRKVASSRLKPYKLNAQKRMTMTAHAKRGMFIDGIHDNRLMSPERNNVQIYKPKYQEHSTKPPTAAMCFDSNPQSVSCLRYMNNHLSNNTSPTTCKLPTVSSSPSIRTSVSSFNPNCMTSLLSITSSLNEFEDSQQMKFPPLRDSTSPLDRSGAAPTIKVKKYDKFLFDRQHYNKVYRRNMLNNQSLYSLALRCMETANSSCHKKSWMHQLQVAVSLGKSNVMKPKMATKNFKT